MEFLSVAGKADALERIGRFGRDGVVMAGGTYVMSEIKRGLRRPAAVIHIDRAGELAAVAGGERPEIGALATHRAIALSPSLEPYGAIRAAAATVGGWQTQNVGTIGGNLCHASPAADLVPPLLVHDARVTLESVRGARTLSLDAFLLGAGRTECAPDELLVSIDVEPMQPGARDLFVKVGRRSAMDTAILSIAIRLTLRDNGRTIEAIRIAVGGAGPTAYRATEAEAILADQSISDEATAAAAEAILARAAPIDDLRASASYRVAALPRVFARALRRAAGPAALH